MARKCVFCEREVPLTLEHAFPLWLSKVFPPALSVTHVHRTEGKVTREYTAANLDAKVKQVCEQCNTGWMHELEEVARPVLTSLIWPRQSRGISPAEQEIIAVWAIKTALMCEFLDTTTISAPRSHFRTLFQILKPPVGSNVWLGAYHVTADTLDYNHRRLTFAFDDPGVPAKHGYLTAFTIGRLCCTSWGWTRKPPGFKQTSRQSQRGVIPIQPRHWVFPRWPPPVAFRDEDIESFLLAIAPERSTEEPRP